MNSFHEDFTVIQIHTIVLLLDRRHAARTARHAGTELVTLRSLTLRSARVGALCHTTHEQFPADRSSTLALNETEPQVLSMEDKVLFVKHPRKTAPITHASTSGRTHGKLGLPGLSQRLNKHLGRMRFFLRLNFASGPVGTPHFSLKEV